jgi:hypothetical protein
MKTMPNHELRPRGSHCQALAAHNASSSGFRATPATFHNLLSCEEHSGHWSLLQSLLYLQSGLRAAGVTRQYAPRDGCCRPYSGAAGMAVIVETYMASSPGPLLLLPCWLMLCPCTLSCRCSFPSPLPGRCSATRPCRCLLACMTMCAQT